MDHTDRINKLEALLSEFIKKVNELQESHTHLLQMWVCLTNDNTDDSDDNDDDKFLNLKK